MHLVEIAEGISVNTDAITVLERVGLGTIVRVGGEVYESHLPYDAFIRLLGMRLGESPLSPLEQLAAFQTRPTP